MTTSPSQSVLKLLRAVVPKRLVAFDEALQVAELQASKLHELIGSTDGVREVDLAGLPRLQIVREVGLPVSGISHWHGKTWIITINADDPLPRQRFTVLHEFKHILDHGYAASLYSSRHQKSSAEQAEAAADYFAGCALVPKRYLKSAWGHGVQTVSGLAAQFGVSQHAVRVRLAQTGLDAYRDQLPPARCARPISTPRSETQRFRTVRPTTRRTSA